MKMKTTREGSRRVGLRAEGINRATAAHGCQGHCIKGGKYLSSQVLGKLVEAFRSRVRDTRMRPRISTLTPREREMLKLLGGRKLREGNRGILGLSVKTVEAHKLNLMRKLDIHNKAQLVIYAIQKKIIRFP